MDRALALLNPWQHGFPLQRAPFETVAAQAGLTEAAVLAGYRELHAQGAFDRIGAVFAARAGGAALLAAMAVPPERLEAVAARVSAHPGVNHNYEREHALNLWFVMTGADRAAVHAAMDAIEAATGTRALRLPMVRPYRIDLGFDLRGPLAPAPGAPARATPAAAPSTDPAEARVREAERPLAALAEAGLPFTPRPYDAWAQAVGLTPQQVLATLRRWSAAGALSRFGVVVRHHELGFDANAMTVFDVPDEAVDAAGARLAREAGVTLAYRRERAPGWPYNLYAMVHGRDRATVAARIEALRAQAGLAAWPHAVLFSCRRFKQTGARRFRDTVPGPALPEAACTTA